MSLNKESKDTYYFYDNGFMLMQNPCWDPDGNNGKEDCISDTCMAYITYGDQSFVEAVKRCFTEEIVNGKKVLHAWRHPDFIGNLDTMSRDHIIYSLILMKDAGEEDFLKKLSSMLTWKISERYSFTVETWLWMKGIAGNRLAMTAFYAMDIPLFFFNMVWNKVVYALGGFGPEKHQNEFEANNRLPKRKLFFRKIHYPTYTLHQKAFQLYVSQGSIGKWIMKKIGLMMSDKQNYLFKLLFGGKVEEKDIYEYKPMTFWRWSTKLNDVNDRDVWIINNEKMTKRNSLDVDLLRFIYENRDLI